ncbi:MAG: hypothetical protein ACNS64_12475 [Candidatus Halalkalibacterium sp. M3_1C_030]
MSLHIGGSWDPLERIKELVSNLRVLSATPDGGECHFSTIDFIHPISILPIASYTFDHNITIKNANSYLDSIEFPEGKNTSEFSRIGKTYFPITKADLRTADRDEREKKLRLLSDQYPRLLRRNIDDQEFLNRVGNNVFYLLISEMVDNIMEHSEAALAYIFSQFWPGNDSCEICLLDNGIGIYQSLDNAGRDVDNDIDAVKKVIKHHLSAKDEFGSQKRGTGIKNTINLLSNDELNGYFCVISGRAGYYIDNSGRNHFINLTDVSWNGTIVGMGFQKPSKQVNIYEYIR